MRKKIVKKTASFPDNTDLLCDVIILATFGRQRAGGN